MLSLDAGGSKVAPGWPMTSFPAPPGVLHIGSSHTLVFSKIEMKCTAGSSLLNSQSTCLFQGHFCCTSGIEVLQTVSLAAQSPRHEAEILLLLWPWSAVPSGEGSPGGLLSDGGASAGDRALCEMTWFTKMCRGQFNRKEWTWCFHFYSVYRNNFPVTHAGLCLGSWPKAPFTQEPWPLPFWAIRRCSHTPLRASHRRSSSHLKWQTSTGQGSPEENNSHLSTHKPFTGSA